MSFLPIVDRELRVASRRWSTFLVRTGVGLLAMVISAPVLFFGWLAGGSASAGQGAFSALTGYAFVVCLLAGLLITADCLSGEKREGTLGLLFLTDLRGYDVVLGKFSALGLNSIYAMLAIFPVLALPLLTGGVTGGQFWRVALALLNLLFVSLAAGMAVSAFARNATRSFTGTVVLLLLWVLGLPGVASLAQTLGSQSLNVLAWVSPATAFAEAKAAGYPGAAGRFWMELGASHASGWLMLLLSVLALPRTWQDRVADTGRRKSSRWGKLFAAQRRQEMLDRNPMLWLMGDRVVLRMILWILAGIWSVAVLAACFFLEPQVVMGSLIPWFLLVLFLVNLLLVEHSCRFWVEARQSGSLEALLAVPLNSRAILSSHWASIRRHFLWPLVSIVAMSSLPTWLHVSQVLSGKRTSADAWFTVLFANGYLGVLALWFLATFIAIGWTGMWLALKLRRPQFAIGLTVLIVVLLPMMLCWFGVALTLICIFLPMSLLQSNLRGMILQHYMPVVKGRAAR